MTDDGCDGVEKYRTSLAQMERDRAKVISDLESNLPGEFFAVVRAELLSRYDAEILAKKENLARWKFEGVCPKS